MMNALTTLNLCIEHSSQCSLKKNKKKKHSNWKKSKALFTHKLHSCLHRKSYGIYQKGKILINEFYTGTGYKINIQNQLYSSIVKWTTGNWNKILLLIESRNTKFRGINPTKNLWGMYIKIIKHFWEKYSKA